MTLRGMTAHTLLLAFVGQLGVTHRGGNSQLQCAKCYGFCHCSSLIFELRELYLQGNKLIVLKCGQAENRSRLLRERAGSNCKVTNIFRIARPYSMTKMCFHFLTFLNEGSSDLLMNYALSTQWDKVMTCLDLTVRISWHHWLYSAVKVQCICIHRQNHAFHCESRWLVHDC